MRCSDWSSDVFASDLGRDAVLVHNDGSDAAIEVARGHGLTHLDEIPGVSTIDDLAGYVDRVMAPGSGAIVRSLNRGRVAYWDEGAQSVIIHNSREPWRSTVSVPSRGFQKFMDLACSPWDGGFKNQKEQTNTERGRGGKE